VGTPAGMGRATWMEAECFSKKSDPALGLKISVFGPLHPDSAFPGVDFARPDDKPAVSLSHSEILPPSAGSDFLEKHSASLPVARPIPVGLPTPSTNPVKTHSR
jgi:hypothetical protein